MYWGMLLQLLNDRLKMMKIQTMVARRDEFYICGWNEEDMKGHSSGVAGIFGARDEW
jgi:hypothetical protein